MNEKQYSIVWTGFGTWLILFCIDSSWVSTNQNSFIPGIGALDSNPNSATLWGAIVGSMGLLFISWLVFHYAKNQINNHGDRFSSPAIFGLENDTDRSKLINKWGNFLFIYSTTTLISLMQIKILLTGIYNQKSEKMIDGEWFDARVTALKSSCNAYTEFCFRIGDAKGDEYFPVATDLIPIILFLIAIFYLVKWKKILSK